MSFLDSSVQRKTNVYTKKAIRKSTKQLPVARSTKAVLGPDEESGPMKTFGLSAANELNKQTELFALLESSVHKPMQCDEYEWGSVEVLGALCHSYQDEMRDLLQVFVENMHSVLMDYEETLQSYKEEIYKHIKLKNP
jgi:hypothetical protein